MGFHGRDRRVMPAMCVLLLLLAFAPAAMQAPVTVEDLPPAIVLKPLFAQRVQILDVAVLNPRGLLVLDRAGVTRYELEGDPSAGRTLQWRRIESVPLPSRPWPRDLRGHLVADNDRYAVLLPGTDCVAQFNPLRMACAERRVPWPLFELPNSGLEPDRNYFTTPEGLTVYGGSTIASDADGFIVADRQGRLTQLDANRRPIADLGTGDDVVRMRPLCSDGRWHYLAASRGREGDVLRAFTVQGGRVVTATADLPLPGAFTALSSVGARTFVVTRLSGGERYDAFQADITSCR